VLEKKQHDLLDHIDAIPMCDRQTAGHSIYRTMHVHSAVKIE